MIADHEMAQREYRYEASARTTDDLIARTDNPGPFLIEASRFFKQAAAATAQARATADHERQGAVLRIAATLAEVAGCFLDCGFVELEQRRAAAALRRTLN